ncbi:YdcF family protein (plasmid) [Chryseobacterium panacisoli]|uniref:YdcF family protein n=1 Tax=Chryseobacterium panacisoli TaxID=1807141 RepID=A0A5D8ZX91_9FLAO|nr:YdcF family protein [Chryseobacterium panacisoli]TZF98682.1 YdcF family protein [Chryseobacterium panacisoli]
MKFLLDLLFRVLQLFAEPYFLLFLAVVIIALLKRKNKRKNLRIGIGVLVVLMIIFIGNGFLGKLISGYLQKSYVNTSEMKNAAGQNPVIVVLGGGVVDINNTEKLHTMSFSRIVTAYQLYHEFKKNNIPCKIIISGKGKGHTSEAELFSENFKKMGVSDFDIIKEDKSMNTYQNAKFSSPIVKKMAPTSVYLVTSGFHMKRSVALFQTFGLKPIPQASDFINTEITIFPNSYNAAFTFVMLKEILGIWQVQIYNNLGMNG